MKWKNVVVLALAFCFVLEPGLVLAKGGGSSSGGGSRSSGGGFSSSGSRSSGWGGSSSSGVRSSSGWGGSSSGSSAPKSSWSGSSSSSSSSGGTKSGWGGSWSSSGSSSSGSSSGGWSGSSSKTITTTTPRVNVQPTSVSKKPAAPSFDKVAITDAKKAESRVNYQKANEPAQTYKTPKGETKSINPKDPETDYLRGRLDESRWVNRNQRETTFYSRYSGPSYPVVTYSDPYHPMMNYWLLSQTMDTMAMFIICHEHSMEQARIRDLYARNTQLEAQVAAMRARGVKADPTWYPAGFNDPDLLYNEDYVDATYNPHPKEVTEYTYSDYDGPTFDEFINGVWVLIKWIFYIAVAIFLSCLVIRLFSYLLFERRYGA